MLYLLLRTGHFQYYDIKLHVYHPVHLFLLENVYNGEVDLGDYDNDQDLDVLLIGYYKDFMGNELKALKLYQNLGDFGFIEIFSEFIGMSESNVGWADYDGDGDLDILANGSTEAPTHLVYLYQNQGDNNFLNIGIEIFGTVSGSVDWGDYDNDGDLDFLLTGMASYGNEPVTEIYRNIAENLFSKADSLTFSNVYNSSSCWGDYDTDGDLDILISGQTNSEDYITALYTNKNTEVNGLPSVPSGLASSINGNTIILHWNNATDPETSSSGLSYNLKLGSLSNSQDIMSSLSNNDGTRQIVKSGNTNCNVS